MEIIGWLVCVAVMLGLTSSALILSFINLGTYNIGGGKNSMSAKFWTLVFDTIVAYGWYGIVVSVPFTVGLK